MKTNSPIISASTGSRIRAYFAGELLADSRAALLVRESPFKMNYAFPEQLNDPEAMGEMSSQQMDELKKTGLKILETLNPVISQWTRFVNAERPIGDNFPEEEGPPEEELA